MALAAQPPPKTIDQYFADWEDHVFGFGYGTGERPILTALKTFFETEDERHCYDYEALEKALTPPTAWLLITLLCKADVLEYGGSPRYSWPTLDKGDRVKMFVASHTVDELVEIVHARMKAKRYVSCDPDQCTCEPGVLREGKEHGNSAENYICQNPFWLESAPWP